MLLILDSIDLKLWTCLTSSACHAGACLIIDLDFKFDLLRLWQVLRCRLQPRLGNEANGIPA